MQETTEAVEVLEFSKRKGVVRIRALAVVFCFALRGEKFVTVSKERLGGPTHNKFSLTVPLEIFIKARELARKTLEISILEEWMKNVATQEEFVFTHEYAKKKPRASRGKKQSKPNRIHRKLSLTT